MTGIPHRLWGAASSRLLSPLVLGIFLLIYIGIAFASDETLIVLMQLTSSNPPLALLLALLPVNYAARLVREGASHLTRRRLLRGEAAEPPSGLFDESIELSGCPDLAPIEGRLAAQGYRTRLTAAGLGAWRGFSLFPARMLYLAGVFCLFAGILISLTTRSSTRGAVIEGVALPTPSGQGGVVERIELAGAPGPILSKHLTLWVAGAQPGAAASPYGLYPPSLYQGAFVYPRYLGVGLHFLLSAPDLPAGYESHSVLAIHPPGKEAAAEIPGSAYQIVFSLAHPEDGSDPYMTGKMVIQFKLLKGKEVVLAGSAPQGGEFARDGYRIAFPDIRRAVMTDFISDHGVYLIWGSALLLVAALLFWLPVRLLAPSREMLFVRRPEGLGAWCRAEGREGAHRGAFSETLDLLEGRRPERDAGQPGAGRSPAGA